jgi:hypothetical protein
VLIKGSAGSTRIGDVPNTCANADDPFVTFEYKSITGVEQGVTGLVDRCRGYQIV